MYRTVNYWTQKEIDFSSLSSAAVEQPDVTCSAYWKDIGKEAKAGHQTFCLDAHKALEMLLEGEGQGGQGWSGSTFEISAVNSASRHISGVLRDLTCLTRMRLSSPVPPDRATCRSDDTKWRQDVCCTRRYTTRQLHSTSGLLESSFT